jgi:hypothetical protein
MIVPKRPKLTKADMADAYELATLRDRDTCQMCHKPGPIQRDHRQNRDQFNTVVSNLQGLCLVDHKWKTEHPMEANATGWGCPRWAVPAEWPARRLIGGAWSWCLYSDDGGVRAITDDDAAQRMGVSS